MGRDPHKMPDDDIAAEFDRVCRLLQTALGSPSERVLFDSLMAEASARGLDWVQGLEFVIERRFGAPEIDLSVPARKGAGRVARASRYGTGDLLRAS